MCLQLFSYDTMSVIIFMLDDSTSYIRTLMPQISILQIPLRSHSAFPSSVFTLIREYSPKDTFANPELPRHASTILYVIIREKCGDGSAGFEPAVSLSCLKWGRFREPNPDDLPLSHPTRPLEILSAFQ